MLTAVPQIGSQISGPEHLRAINSDSGLLRAMTDVFEGVFIRAPLLRTYGFLGAINGFMLVRRKDLLHGSTASHCSRT